MRTVDQLRDALIDRAAVTPDSVGVVEAAYARAARIRRRRRVTVVAAVAVLAAVLAVTPVALARLVRTAPPPASPATSYPGLRRLTLDVDPDSGLVPLAHGFVGPWEHLAMRTPQDSTVDAVVVDAGSLYLSDLKRGEPIAVRGRSAHYAPDLLLDSYTPPSGAWPGGEVRGPAIGWPEPSGVWVVVHILDELSSDAGMATLTSVAEAVRLRPARDVSAPYRFGYVPHGWAVEGVQQQVDGRGGRSDATESTVAFGPRTSTVGPYTGLSVWGRSLVVSMAKHYDGPAELPENGPVTGQIAGRDVRYIESAGSGLAPDHGSTLIIRVGPCDVSVRVIDRDQVPYSELERMVENARFADCTDPRTWTSPLA